GPGAGHAAGRHQLRLRAGIRAAGITAGPGPAGAVDRVALHQAAPASEPPPGPIRQLLLRGPGAGRPVGYPSNRGTVPQPSSMTFRPRTSPSTPSRSSGTLTMPRL